MKEQEMTPEEAIRHLNNSKVLGFSIPRRILMDATQLGIEALKKLALLSPKGEKPPVLDEIGLNSIELNNDDQAEFEQLATIGLIEGDPDARDEFDRRVNSLLNLRIKEKVAEAQRDDTSRRLQAYYEDKIGQARLEGYASGVRDQNEVVREKPPVLSGEQLSEQIQMKAKKWCTVNPEFIEDIANISVKAQYNALVAYYEPLIQQAKAETAREMSLVGDKMLEMLDHADFSNGIVADGVDEGSFRAYEMKKDIEKDWQALKSKYPKDKEEHGET